MTAAITLPQAQSCLHAALADEVTAIGGITTAAQETGSSEDTIGRRLAGSHDWTGKEVAALVAAGHRRLGRSLVTQRMSALVAGHAPAAGDSRRAMGDAMTALPALLAEAQRMAKAVADGRLTRTEARSLLAGIPGLVLLLDTLSADLSAFLREG